MAYLSVFPATFVDYNVLARNSDFMAKAAYSNITPIIPLKNVKTVDFPSFCPVSSSIIYFAWFFSKGGIKLNTFS